METPSKKVKIIFKNSIDNKTVAVTGAYGGPSPQGELIVHFFIEYQNFPDLIELDIEQTPPKETAHRKENIYTREVQTTMVMRPDIAKVIGQWLIANSEKILQSDKRVIH